MIQIIKRLFRRKPVVVNTYRVKKTDFQQERAKKCAELAREMGRQWPAGRV